MSHTYTSCYQVLVPPMDLDASASRASGVRLRSDLESFADLTPFAQLYLPQQMQAQAAEAQRRARGEGYAHAPGWVVSAEEDLAAHIAARNKFLASDPSHSAAASGPTAGAAATAAAAETAIAAATPGVAAAASPDFSGFLASDLLLNGSTLTKSRHAIRREFHAIHGATSGGGGHGIIYGVRHQRGVHQTRKAQADGSFSAGMAAAAAHLDRPAGQSLDGVMGGLPYWMRTEPTHASLPRSTTHAAYTAIPRESSRMDQQWFHAAYEEPVPPTPMRPQSQQQVHHPSLPPATPTPRSLWDSSRVRRMPLLSSAQPNLFLLGSPDAAQAQKAYPAWARTSEILRAEAREQRTARREVRAQAQQQQQAQQWEESKEEQQMFAPALMAVDGSRADRGPSRIHRSGSSHGSRTARSHPQPRPLFNPSAFAAAEPAPPHRPSGSLSARLPSRPERAAATASAGPTFQEHMQAARQRWAEQQQQDSQLAQRQ